MTAVESDSWFTSFKNKFTNLSFFSSDPIQNKIKDIDKECNQKKENIDKECKTKKENIDKECKMQKENILKVVDKTNEIRASPITTPAPAPTAQRRIDDDKTNMAPAPAPTAQRRIVDDNRQLDTDKIDNDNDKIDNDKIDTDKNDKIENRIGGKTKKRRKDKRKRRKTRAKLMR